MIIVLQMALLFFLGVKHNFFAGIFIWKIDVILNFCLFFDTSSAKIFHRRECPVASQNFRFVSLKTWPGYRILICACSFPRHSRPPPPPATDVTWELYILVRCWWCLWKGCVCR